MMEVRTATLMLPPPAPFFFLLSRLLSKWCGSSVSAAGRSPPRPRTDARTCLLRSIPHLFSASLTPPSRVISLPITRAWARTGFVTCARSHTLHSRRRPSSSPRTDLQAPSATQLSPHPRHDHAPAQIEVHTHISIYVGDLAHLSSVSYLARASPRLVRTAVLRGSCVSLHPSTTTSACNTYTRARRAHALSDTPCRLTFCCTDYADLSAIFLEGTDTHTPTQRRATTPTQRPEHSATATARRTCTPEVRTSRSAGPQMHAVRGK